MQTDHVDTLISTCLPPVWKSLPSGTDRTRDHFTLRSTYPIVDRLTPKFMGVVAHRARRKSVAEVRLWPAVDYRDNSLNANTTTDGAFTGFVNTQ